MMFSQDSLGHNQGEYSKSTVHRPGIEPGPPAWQASILPLNQRCFDDTEVRQRDNNSTRTPSKCQAGPGSSHPPLGKCQTKWHP